MRATTSRERSTLAPARRHASLPNEIKVWAGAETRLSFLPDHSGD
jgi:hypothetical protein